MAKRDYVKYYEEYYGIVIPDGFVIHHIDRDRKNNDISNLIMLPRKLHAKYHFYLNSLTSDSFDLDMKLMHNIYTIDGLANTINECRRWVVKKNNMDNEKMWRELNESNNTTH